MRPHQSRVVEEKKQLDDKLTKLRAFLVGEELLKLDVSERERLVRQEGIMQQYSDVLAERVGAFLVEDETVQEAAERGYKS